MNEKTNEKQRRENKQRGREILNEKQKRETLPPAVVCDSTQAPEDLAQAFRRPKNCSFIEVCQKATCIIYQSYLFVAFRHEVI